MSNNLKNRYSNRYKLVIYPLISNKDFGDRISSSDEFDALCYTGMCKSNEYLMKINIVNKTPFRSTIHIY